MSCLLPTGLNVHAHVFGSSSTLRPPSKLSSIPLPKVSIKWNVLVGSTGFPSAYNTNPPPLAIEFDTQAPTPLVGTLARRLPAMLNPPAGGLTGAIPFGGIGQLDASVNDVVAVSPDDAPRACGVNPCPRKLCCTR